MIRFGQAMKKFDLIAFKCSLFDTFEVRGGIKASRPSIFNIKLTCVCLISDTQLVFP